MLEIETLRYIWIISFVVPVPAQLAHLCPFPTGPCSLGCGPVEPPLRAGPLPAGPSHRTSAAPSPSAPRVRLSSLQLGFAVQPTLRPHMHRPPHVVSTPRVRAPRWTKCLQPEIKSCGPSAGRVAARTAHMSRRAQRPGGGNRGHESGVRGARPARQTGGQCSEGGPAWPAAGRRFGRASSWLRGAWWGRMFAPRLARPGWGRVVFGVRWVGRASASCDALTTGCCGG